METTLMNTEIATIDEEEAGEVVRGLNHQKTTERASPPPSPTRRSPRSSAKPKRTQSSNNASPRSPSKGFLSLQFLNGNSISALDAINLEDLPVENRQTRQIRQSRADARERLHNSMSDLEGFTPEDLLQEVNRRRQERAEQRQKLSKSLPVNPVATGRTQQNHFRASMPAIPSEELTYNPPSLESTPRDNAAVVTDTDTMLEEPRVKTRQGNLPLWQTSDCCGVLEVACKLEWDYRGRLEPRYVEEYKEFFDTSCLQVWAEMKLAKEFRKTCSSLPVSTTCCGLVTDDEQTIMDTVNSLNKGWIKDVNQRLKARRAPFKLDAFVFTWYHIQAKKTSLLIRFLATNR